MILDFASHVAGFVVDIVIWIKNFIKLITGKLSDENTKDKIK
ncbi:MAG TPA: hypothetical protein VD947_04175 [Patescibacteria group bacterium]|nr:hypothetical protein [Patescibacteria group bacterium]